MIYLAASVIHQSVLGLNDTVESQFCPINCEVFSWQWSPARAGSSKSEILFDL
jgi:hypothetical protein